jgi:hypothetical protein
MMIKISRYCTGKKKIVKEVVAVNAPVKKTPLSHTHSKEKKNKNQSNTQRVLKERDIDLERFFLFGNIRV